MALTDSEVKAHTILRTARFPVPRAVLQDRLGCSRATLTRIIAKLRGHLRTPIEYDRNIGGYRLAGAEHGLCELPGLWFDAAQLHALLAAHQLLIQAQPGLLERDLTPLIATIEGFLEARGVPPAEVGRRVRILRMAARRLEPEPFRTVAGAVLGRKRLRLAYHGRARDERTERRVSPQRLTHYRDNWYLDAWDHDRRALRSFSVDRIHSARQLDGGAREIADARLDEHFASAYGIFAGKPKHTARLRFGGESARWVADEIWHPEQKGWSADGHYFLEIPYADSRELVRDILKYGADVTVLAPVPLRDEVRRCLRAALTRYE